MTQTQRDSVIHLVAGGVAGTVAAIVTCPLEVVKTRQQSSNSGFRDLVSTTPIAGSQSTTCRTLPPRRRLWTTARHGRPQVVALSGYVSSPGGSSGGGGGGGNTGAFSIVQCLKHIVKNEGPMALFKGLGPNLVGVAPSRAVYFATYSQAKIFWNNVFPPDSPVVHVCSASCAGFMASTLTNPIWFVKTRLQLDINKDSRMTALECVRRIYAKSGILGFYKGITASYMGISETIVHFVIYEAIKAELLNHRRNNMEFSSGTATNEEQRGRQRSKDFLEFMMAGAISKTVASCIAYPHEVARTRLREEGNRYTGFWQTLGLVFKEEGLRGVYRGLTTQLVRQIPNTAIMMATYETVVYMLTTKYNSNNNDSELYDGKNAH